MIIRKGSPDSVTLWFDDDGAGSYGEFLDSIPEEVLTDESSFVDVEAGRHRDRLIGSELPTAAHAATVTLGSASSEGPTLSRRSGTSGQFRSSEQIADSER